MLATFAHAVYEGARPGVSFMTDSACLHADDGSADSADSPHSRYMAFSSDNEDINSYALTGV